MIVVGNAGARYTKYSTDRDQYLERARKCAELTIPTLIPQSENTSSTKYPTPFQGLGARGVNNLASKLLLSLFPPNSPFFKLLVDNETLEKLAGTKDLRAEVESALGSIERTVQGHVETTNLRVKMFEALKHLLVGGNILLHQPSDSGMRVHHLKNYVIKRAPDGNVLEIIIQESVTPLALSKKIREACDVKIDDNAVAPKMVSIFTAIYKTEKRWEVFQEINKKLVPDSTGHYPFDKTPWIPLRFSAVDNEDYGRGFVEEYLGDLISLEGLTKAIVQGSAAAAKVVFLVNPNGVTDAKVITDSCNGAAVAGNANDVTTLQLDKFADFRVAESTIARLEDRLGFAFLLNTSIQRNGERVTAEEIRFMAGELEDGLGGTYSILSQELQLPLVNLLIRDLEKKGKLPTLPKDEIKPSIVTGLEALGRGHDLNKIMLFSDTIRSALGQEVVDDYIKAENFITRTGTSLSVDTDGLVRTEDEVQQRRQQRTMSQVMQDSAPRVAPQVAEAVINPKDEESK